jgi:ADP-heptose:LPS heptosyltransferase
MKERGSPFLHFLDRYAGIPTVGILGSMKAKRQIPSSIESIGILKTGAIGDTVLISGVIADLRCAFPNASIIFFAGKNNLEIVGMLESIDRIIQVSTHNIAAGIKAIRSVAVDVLLDFGQWSRLEALLSIFCRAALTLGFRTQGQHRHYGYDIVVDHSSDIHEFENFRRLICPLGVQTRHAPFLRATGTHLFSDQYVVLHLWPGGRRRKLKEWPNERWLQLIEVFAAQKMNVVLTGAPSDRLRNEELMESATREARGFLTNAAGRSLRETATLLANANLVVSVDTGLMHMAAALGAPLVALHGPTASNRWGPTNPAAVVVEATMEGCGYINLGWEHPASAPACMEAIQYNTVYTACCKVLEGPHPSPMRGVSKVHSSSISGQGA